MSGIGLAFNGVVRSSSDCYVECSRRELLRKRRNIEKGH